ncbi:MAG: hypothetical protein ACLSHC_10915 [Bilophila wadsworthia]
MKSASGRAQIAAAAASSDGACPAQAQLEGETPPAAGATDAGPRRGPVVALRGNPIFVEEVEVVGDAQFVGPASAAASLTGRAWASETAVG